MKKTLVAVTIALISLGSVPGLAYSDQDKDPRELASEGIQSLLKALEMMLLAIPQYEAPFVNENGDIIIRRKNPPQEREIPTVREGKKKEI